MYMSPGIHVHSWICHFMWRSHSMPKDYTCTHHISISMYIISQRWIYHFIYIHSPWTPQVFHVHSWIYHILYINNWVLVYPRTYPWKLRKEHFMYDVVKPIPCTYVYESTTMPCTGVFNGKSVTNSCILVLWMPLWLHVHSYQSISSCVTHVPRLHENSRMNPFLMNADAYRMCASHIITMSKFIITS